MHTSTIEAQSRPSKEYLSIQAGGLDALRESPEKLRSAVDFATACGAFTTTKPGGIDAQPSQEQAQELLKKTPHAKAAV